MASAAETLKAYLHCARTPSEEALQRIRTQLKKQYGAEVVITVSVEPELISGYVLQVGDQVIDNSAKHMLENITAGTPDLATMQTRAEDYKPAAEASEGGTVISAADGVVDVKGMDKAVYGEIVTFDTGAKGMVESVEPDHLGVMLFDDIEKVGVGTLVTRSGKRAGIPVGDAFLGRVISPLGEPIDGKGPIEAVGYNPIEKQAPGILERQSVDTPLHTGILAIDSMFPIGRGQRELIIGDRQIGKTAIAIDTIINQRKNYEEGKPVYCIYVAIGQKASSVAAIVETLRQHGALDYTCVVAATASDSAAMRYYSPFAGVAIGEYIRDTGRDALIVYDDLSKQAVAYREISLILKRPSGREAYPGDIFYLHSRLLERAAKIIDNQQVAESMNDLPEVLKGRVKGGGSLTALPIIETQAGDVSAYIPTNVISITDGQIYLETALFNRGIRPAINVGISVSRVGGNAQIKSMKKVAGTLKIDQAQFRELESFTKFGGDIDPVTARVIDRGRKNERLLIQPQYKPWAVEDEVAVIYCGVNGLLGNVPVDKVADFQEALLQLLHAKHQADVLDVIKSGQLTDDCTAKLTAAANEVAARYN